MLKMNDRENCFDDMEDKAYNDGVEDQIRQNIIFN